MPQLKVGSEFRYDTPLKRYRGTVVALGGGFVVGALAVVSTDRDSGSEVDAVGPVSVYPLVLPVDAVTAL